MSNIINQDLFKINQLDYTDSYGKYDISNISGKASYDKYITDKKNQQRFQRSSNGNSADKYKLNSIILQPETNSILLSSDNILNYLNKKTINERLKMNNAYIIHVIEYKYIDYRKGPDGTSLVSYDQKEILIVDNYCNYHIIRNGLSSDATPNDIFEVIPSEELKHFQLPDQIVDIIKNINGCQILGINYTYNNVYNLLDGIANYVKNYYNVQNQKVEIHQTTTNNLTTELDATYETVESLSATVNTHEQTINKLTETVSENNTLISNLQNTINKLNNEKNQIQAQSDKYREEIRQYKFNNILYIETTE